MKFVSFFFLRTNNAIHNEIGSERSSPIRAPIIHTDANPTKATPSFSFPASLRPAPPLPPPSPPPDRGPDAEQRQQQQDDVDGA